MSFFAYFKEEFQVIQERDPAIHSPMEVLLYPSFRVMLNGSQKIIKCWHCWGGWNYPWDTRYDGNYYDDHFETMVSLLEDAVTRADSKEQQIRAENFTCHMYYEGCYSLYFKAEAAGNTELMQTLSDRYDLMIERLYKHGFDPCGIGIATVDGHRQIYKYSVSKKRKLGKSEVEVVRQASSNRSKLGALNLIFPAIAPSKSAIAAS